MVSGSVLDESARSPASSNAGGSTRLTKADVWEVISEIPVTNKGTYLPAKLSLLNRHRKLSVEVHKILPTFEDEGEDAADGTSASSRIKATDAPTFIPEAEVCYLRIFDPPSTFAGHRARQKVANFAVDPKKEISKVADDAKKELNKAEKGVRDLFSSNKPKDDSSIVTERGANVGDDSDVDTDARDEFKDSDVNEAETFQGWYPKYRIPIRMVEIIEHKKRKVELKGERKGHVLQREFTFESESAADEFCATVEKNIKLQDKRSKDRLEYMLSGITLQKDEQLTLLIDICSASDLPAADVGRESDPYVTVRFNGRKIHKTSYISHEDNPIWTLRTKSLFIWKVDALELFQSEDGLIFEVKDYDAVGENESLGAFNVSPKTLYNWNGERRKFMLKPLIGKKDYGKGSVALRVRRATPHDIEFMDNLAHHKKNKSEQYYFSNLKGGAGTLKSLTTTTKKKEKEGPDKDKIKYLVRPSPDPKRKEATTWLTKETIEKEAMEDSFNWIDVGSGNLGKIFVEVIGCDNLPNMDSGGFGNKTDAFVSLVYEDCFARTDVINDCLSPKWLPWSQRAYIFNMMHTSSQLFLGVFDYDVNRLSSHDFIGRVSVDISNFQPDTVYVLHYKLYPTAHAKVDRDKFDQKFEKDPSKHSTITIRLRMELADNQTLLLSNFHFPEQVYVNVESKKDFHVLRQTIIGSRDLRQYGLGNIGAYIEELWDVLTIYYYLEDATKSLVLWRSSSTVPLPLPNFKAFGVQWVKVSVPLHSMLAFLLATSLVENLELVPSFSFGCIVWMMIATLEMRAHNPNPWKRSQRLSRLLYSLVIGKNISSARAIEPNENLDAIKRAEEMWKERLKDAKEKAEKRALQYQKEQEQYWQEMAELEADADIGTKLGGLSFDPTKAWLLPIQQWLGIICESLRVVRNVIYWEEPYISFWITLGCLLLSLLFYFVPWGFVVRWTLRIVVWTVLGPWMKLADIFYFSKIEPETHAQKVERENRLQMERDKWLEAQKLELQLKKESASKLKDFKQTMFGEYVCNVNILKRDRFFDIPISASKATPYNPERSTLGSLAMREAGYHRHRVKGQHLVGDMIPTLVEETESLTEAPVGKPAKKIEQLKDDSPGMLYSGDDSYSSAVFKVGSILSGAAAITWFGVPIVCYVVKAIMNKTASGEVDAV